VKTLLLNFKENVPRQWNKGQMWKKRFYISSYLMWKDVSIPHHITLYQLPPDAKKAFQLMWKILSVVVKKSYIWSAYDSWQWQATTTRSLVTHTDVKTLRHLFVPHEFSRSMWKPSPKFTKNSKLPPCYLFPRISSPPMWKPYCQMYIFQ